MTDNQSQPPILGTKIALFIAVFVLFGGGLAYRLAQGYYARDVEAAPLPPGTLGRLPFRLGDWTGADVPLAQSVVERTDADQVLNRRYTRRGGESVMLYVSHGVRARDLMPHRPEVCYPGAGWTLVDAEQSSSVDLGDDDQRYRVLRFERSGLIGETLTVLNYYLVDGQCAPDVSHLRSRIWRRSGGVTHVAQIQIMCGGGGSLKPSDSVRAFASVSTKEIRSLLSDGSPTDARTKNLHD